MSTCFCGCGEPAEMKCSCGYFTSKECQCNKFCNMCAYKRSCAHCDAYFRQLDNAVNALYATREVRALTPQERAEATQLQERVRDEWHRCVLDCMLDFA